MHRSAYLAAAILHTTVPCMLLLIVHRYQSGGFHAAQLLHVNLFLGSFLHICVYACVEDKMNAACALEMSYRCRDLESETN